MLKDAVVDPEAAPADAASAKTDPANERPEPGKNPPKVKRKRLGRSARRKHKKRLEILRAEKELLAAASGQRPEGQSASGSSISLLPSDRDRVWPGVLERRCRDWNPRDAAALVGQLGYVPGNVLSIPTRLHQVPVLLKQSLEQAGGKKDNDVPVVVQLYPIVVRDQHSGGRSNGRKYKARKRMRQASDSSGTATTTDSSSSSTWDCENSLIEPFPTMYWLTHPLLRVWVSKLELSGLGGRLERRLEGDAEARERMERAHRAHGRERSALLTESDRELVAAKKWQSAFCSARGVAGIRNYKAVKCLHAHAAHYLAGTAGGHSGCGDNVVGRWVVEALEEMLKEQQQQRQQQDAKNTSTQRSSTEEDNSADQNMDC